MKHLRKGKLFDNVYETDVSNHAINLTRKTLDKYIVWARNYLSFVMVIHTNWFFTMRITTGALFSTLMRKE